MAGVTTVKLVPDFVAWEIVSSLFPVLLRDIGYDALVPIEMLPKLMLTGLTASCPAALAATRRT